jgi:hypothetical protein
LIERLDWSCHYLLRGQQQTLAGVLQTNWRPGGHRQVTFDDLGDRREPMSGCRDAFDNSRKMLGATAARGVADKSL